MQISTVTISNVLGINAGPMDLPSVVKIMGKNGAGKSRMVNAIFSALAYGNLDKAKREELLKCDGEIDLEIRGGSEPITVCRKFKNGKTTLLVKSDGMRGNQATLDALIGHNFVDLQKFLNLSNEKRDKAVLEMVGLSEPLRDIESKRKEFYLERQGVGREVKALDPGVEPEKVERVNAAELVSEIQAADENNRKIANIKTSIDGLGSELSATIASISGLEAKIVELKIKKQWIESEAKSREASLESMKVIDTSAISESLRSAEDTNRKAAIYEQWAVGSKSFKAKKSEYDHLTDEVSNCDEDRSSLISGAEFPIDGLSYDGEALTYNGHRLISDGQHRKIAFQIARKLKGDLGVAIFENFSLLDEDAQAEVIRDAEDAGFQVFLELVSSKKDGEQGFYIEDGSIV